MLAVRAGCTWTSAGPSGGVPLDTIGRVGDLNYKTILPGGFLTASFQMQLPVGASHPALRQGSLVVLHDGGIRIGYGRMAEPNRVDGTFTVDGPPLDLRPSGDGYGCLALDAAKEPTTNLTVAITQAAARGWWIRVGTGVPNTAFSSLSEDLEKVNYLTDLLDAYCRDTGTRWIIDPSGAVNIVADPAAGDIDWILTPGVPAMPVADREYASLVVMRHATALTGTDVTAWDTEAAQDAATTARRPSEMFEDVTDQGLLANPTASAAAILAANAARSGFTESVEPFLFQVTTPGGRPAHPTHIRAGQRVRHLGTLSTNGAFAIGKSPEWVLGGTDYTNGATTITLAPVDLAPRTQAHIVKAMAARSEDGFQ